MLYYSGPVVIDSADMDTYVAAAAAISQKLLGLLCIKRKQETILCQNLVPEEMADCIVPLHCLTGYNVNSGFYGKGKLSVYDKVARHENSSQSVEIPLKLKRKQLRSCLNLLGLLSMGIR